MKRASRRASGPHQTRASTHVPFYSSIHKPRLTLGTHARTLRNLWSSSSRAEGRCAGSGSRHSSMKARALARSTVASDYRCVTLGLKEWRTGVRVRVREPLFGTEAECGLERGGPTDGGRRTYLRRDVVGDALVDLPDAVLALRVGLLWWGGGDGCVRACERAAHSYVRTCMCCPTVHKPHTLKHRSNPTNRKHAPSW